MTMLSASSTCFPAESNPEIDAIPTRVNFPETAPSDALSAKLKALPPIFTSFDNAEYLDANGWRGIVLHNVYSESLVSEVIGTVSTGFIEEVRFIPQKSVATIIFVNHMSALHFYSTFLLTPANALGANIRASCYWVPPPHPLIIEAIDNEGACRNIYIGRLPDGIDEYDLRKMLGQFGTFELVKIIPSSRIAFVHFFSIASAMSAMQFLRNKPDWILQNVKVAYGRDPCSNLSKLQKQSVLLFFETSPNNTPALAEYSRKDIWFALASQVTSAISVAYLSGGAENIGNRCVFLGQLSADTTISEIFNAVRGGIVQNIRYFPERHISFVLFADPSAAATFFAMCNSHRLYIKNRAVKVRWGKPSGPLPPGLVDAISLGATRNIFVGDLPRGVTEQELLKDFSKFGTIEQVNILDKRSCAFINFTDLECSIFASQWARASNKYGKLRIRFGKDRCANQPRILQNNPRQQLPFMMQWLCNNYGQSSRMSGVSATSGPSSSRGPRSSRNSTPMESSPNQSCYQSPGQVFDKLNHNQSGTVSPTCSIGSAASATSTTSGATLVPKYVLSSSKDNTIDEYTEWEKDGFPEGITRTTRSSSCCSVSSCSTSSTCSFSTTVTEKVGGF